MNLLLSYETVAVQVGVVLRLVADFLLTQMGFPGDSLVAEVGRGHGRS